jgi:uncharacterized tellurite resistance protein B-like protein
MPNQPFSSANSDARNAYSSLFDSLMAPLLSLLESIAPSAETLARRDALALQSDCCALLMEVARLGPDAEQNRSVVAQVMCEQFSIPDEELAAMIETASRPDNRLTSYYPQIARINQRFGPARKVQFVEQLWRVAMVDGNIDTYEDHLVRKLSDLLYVPHADFILAKNRVQARFAARADGTARAMTSSRMSGHDHD